MDNESFRFRGTRRQWLALGWILVGLIGVIVSVWFGETAGLDLDARGIRGAMSWAVVMIVLVEFAVIYAWLANNVGLSVASMHRYVHWTFPVAFVVGTIPHSRLVGFGVMLGVIGLIEAWS